MIKFANIKILLIFPVLLAVLYLFDSSSATHSVRARLQHGGRWMSEGQVAAGFPERRINNGVFHPGIYQHTPNPPSCEKAVLCFEDRRIFTAHPGANPLLVWASGPVPEHLFRGEIISGASTITMQVARLMRPKERTYFNKALEILQALKIELSLLKGQEILQPVSRTTRPMASNIVGYQAAAHKYFRKPPDELTWSEAATLAVLPNAPGLVSPTANPQQLVQKRNRLLTSLGASRPFRRGDLAA